MADWMEHQEDSLHTIVDFDLLFALAAGWGRNTGRFSL